MATNPLIAQGTLNRLRGSVVWTDFPELNVTAPYLGKDGIRLALEGESTVMLPTMTGVVTSPEPYMMVSLVMSLLKTQGLSDAYKEQMELTALLGDGTVRADASTLGNYNIINCAIESIGELRFNGEEAVYPVTCKGYYLINSSMWNFQ